MFTRRRFSTALLPVAVIGMLALATAACSSSASGTSDAGEESSPSDNAGASSDDAQLEDTPADSPDEPADSAEPVTVWLMTGSLADDALSELTAEFTEQTGIPVTVEQQQWADIVTKLSTALATNNPPDVVQIGNTNVALFAASGALADLSDHEQEFAGHDSWVEALDVPAHFDGKLFAVPMYSATRQVIYNKEMWAAAGVTEPPATYEEFLADLDAIKAANPDPTFSAFELQGYDKWAALSWLYDTGGSVAYLDGDQWQSGVTSAESLAGLQNYQHIQNEYSAVATRSMRNGERDTSISFANEQAATYFDKSGTLNKVLAANPEMDGKVGSFALPSMTHPGELAPVFAGGSNLAVSAGSAHFDEAVKFLAFISSDAVQTKYVIDMSANQPASAEVANKLLDSRSEFERPSFEALASGTGIAAPSTPGWVTIEGDASLDNFFTQVAENEESLENLTAAFSQHLETVLNAAP